MRILNWAIGDVRVTRVPELETGLSASMLLADATPELLDSHSNWLRPHFVDPDGQLLLSIHALVVESAGLTILVDTCVGEKKVPGFEILTPENSRFLETLVEAGFTRESIDVVLCTHLHFDHVGWNTMRDGDRWVPTFPNARYLFAREEWEHWRGEGPNPFTPTLEEAVQPVFDAGLAHVVDSNHKITDEVWLEPTPGHTPGHVSVRITSAGFEAFITGDMTHHPVQWAHPDWKMSADTDSGQAEATRRRIARDCGNTKTLVIGTHYAAPCSGRLVSVDGECRFHASES